MGGLSYAYQTTVKNKNYTNLTSKNEPILRELQAQVML